MEWHLVQRSAIKVAPSLTAGALDGSVAFDSFFEPQAASSMLIVINKRWSVLLISYAYYSFRFLHVIIDCVAHSPD